MLEESRNPFAIVVMAHLKAQRSRRDGQERKTWKLSLVKRLYEQGFQRQDILDLFQFIDWILVLPKALEADFRQELAQYEEEKQMPYITSIERRALAQGLLAGIRVGLERKFGNAGLQLLPAISDITDAQVLEAILDGLWTVDSLEELQRIYHSEDL